MSFAGSGYRYSDSNDEDTHPTGPLGIRATGLEGNASILGGPGKNTDGTSSNGGSTTYKRPPLADAKINKRNVVLKAKFKNAFSDNVRRQCKKRYADGHIGFMPISVIDRLDEAQLEQLDDHIVALRGSWQSADSKGRVLLSNKSEAFFRNFHDGLEPFLNWDLPVKAFRTLHSLQGGARLITELSHPEWGISDSFPIVAELDNVYPSFKVGGEDGDVVYWNNGYHIMAVMQFLELCRYRGYLGFDHFYWLKREKESYQSATRTIVDMASMRKSHHHHIRFGASHQKSKD